MANTSHRIIYLVISSAMLFTFIDVIHSETLSWQDLNRDPKFKQFHDNLLNKTGFPVSNECNTPNVTKDNTLVCTYYYNLLHQINTTGYEFKNDFKKLEVFNNSFCHQKQNFPLLNTSFSLNDPDICVNQCTVPNSQGGLQLKPICIWLHLMGQTIKSGNLNRVKTIITNSSNDLPPSKLNTTMKKLDAGIPVGTPIHKAASNTSVDNVKTNEKTGNTSAFSEKSAVNQTRSVEQHQTTTHKENAASADRPENGASSEKQPKPSEEKDEPRLTDIAPVDPELQEQHADQFRDNDSDANGINDDDLSEDLEAPIKPKQPPLVKPTDERDEHKFDQGILSRIHTQKDPFYEETGSNFFTYFLVGMFLSIVLYVMYHNKTKIFALLVEGRKGDRGRSGRRKHTASYRKLDSNLEEVITSSSGGRTTQIIY